MRKFLEINLSLLFLLSVFLPASALWATSPQIGAGFLYTVALKNDGTVWVWGNNQDGQLGNGGTTVSPTPVPIQVSRLIDVATISAGHQHIVALKSDRTLWAWGIIPTNLSYRWGFRIPTFVTFEGLDNTQILKIAAGLNHTVAILSDGTVWGLGRNSRGELGTTRSSSSTVQAVRISGLSHIGAVAVGDYHTVALKDDGTVLALGDNSAGQLGNGTTTNSSIPVQVSGLSDVIAISSGSYHAVALKADGSVWAWGSNRYDQVGNGTTNATIPVQISGLNSITAIAAGHYHNLALKNDGTVWAWGGNRYGQIGNGTTMNSSIPVQIPEFYDVAGIAGGFSHSEALKYDGTVWAWGSNIKGELGNGTISDSWLPVQVLGSNSQGFLNLGNLTTPRPADRIFNWAEWILPELFPRGGTSQTFQNYYYRYYPATNVYLAVMNNRIYYYNPAENSDIVDFGEIGEYLPSAQAAGF